MKHSKILFTCVVLYSFILVSCQHDVYTGTAPDPPAQNGKVFILSSPSNTLIYYQKKYTGLKTPDTLTWLANGNHTIVLKKELFKDTTFVVETLDKTTTNIFIDYYSNPGHYGKFTCTSIPRDADILINDSSTGFITPHLFEHYFPGYYKVKVSKPEHRPDSTIFAIEGGKTKNVNFVIEDTSKWVSYLSSNSKIPTMYFNDILTDHKNIKWAAADSGVVSFNGKNWNYFTYHNSALPNGVVFKLAVDAANNIWAATIKGLFVFNGSTWMNYTGNLPSSVVTSVTNDKNGVIWIGTAGGLVRFDGAQWKIFTTQNSGLFNNAINTVSVAPNGTVWFGSIGVGSYNGNTWTEWTFKKTRLDSSIGKNIKDLKADLDGNIWVAHTKSPKIGIRGGFTMYNGSVWSEISIPSLQVDDIKSINVDAANNKWIGTAVGLGKFLQPENVSVLFHLSLWVLMEEVRGTTIDQNGDLWVATFGDGLAKIKKGNF